MGDIDALLGSVTTLDFETHPIGPRPHQYPPRPVGLAIRWPNGRGEYLSWGHVSDNNCTEQQAKAAWGVAASGPVLFHNAKFDLEVAWRWWGMRMPRYWHDTLFMLFLHEAHAPSFALKPAAERLLNEPPNEQNALRDWIVANVSGATHSSFMKFVAEAPGSVVAPYAIGDVRRTFRLFEKLAPEILTTQRVPYDRERRLMPYLVQAEQRGVRVDSFLLRDWEGLLESQIIAADSAIYNELNLTFNVDSNDELADALERAGRVTQWERTTTGRRKTSKDALARCINGSPNLSQLIVYRNTASTMLGTFVRPWIASAAVDGRLHTQWHQVRGQDKNGTRTGRMASSDPNLGNIPVPAEIVIPASLLALPELRRALLPEEEEVWVNADYNSQEMRLAAHFEDGPLLQAYQNHPAMDVHVYAAELVTSLLRIPMESAADRKKWRRICKTTGFLLIYGGGVERLALQLKCPYEQANEIRNTYFAAVPGLRQVIGLVKQQTELTGSVRSLGGRLLTAEPPITLPDGDTRSFVYKMFNKLVQGSAADQTKEAIIKFSEAGTTGRLLTTVYDEINVSAPPEGALPVANELSRCMITALPCDTPMLVDVEIGSSWGELKSVEGVVG